MLAFEFSYFMFFISISVAAFAINYKLKAEENALEVIEMLEKSIKTWSIAYIFLIFSIIFLFISINIKLI